MEGMKTRMPATATYQKYFNGFLKMALLTSLASSCLLNAPRDRSSSSGGISNSPSSVEVGYGRVLHGHPFALASNYSLSPETFDLSKLIYADTDFITNNQFLEGACQPNGTSGSGYISPCFEVRKEDTSDQLDPSNNKWAYDPSSDEFLEVNTYWHIKYQLERWEETLVAGQGTAAVLGYTTSYPTTMFTTYANWKSGTILKAYSDCDLADNAYFSPSNYILCFGYNSDYPKVKYAQDPTIIYHELGHTFTNLAVNIRNADDALDTRSELGYAGYDEAGSINEGLSDYYVYYMTGGKMFGEWALDSFDIPYVVGSAARPMSEGQSIHASSVGTDQDSRLAYPDYLTYDPNQYDRLDGKDPQEIEDIHYAGQIASHYWVALTEDLMGQCNMTQQTASSAVMSLITETLAELGDLSAQGTDGGTGRINHSATWAKEWLTINKPITYRSFFQTFAKYLRLVFNLGAQCNGSSYSSDSIEQLLDQYGLLLFRNYNEDGNSEAGGHAGTHTAVTVTNRIYTETTSKDLLMIDPRTGAYDAIVVDNRTDIQNTITSLTQAGIIMSSDISTIIPSDFKFNNSNNKINPGEVVALSLNLYNDSNTVMAGVQLLANDWDHVKDGKPCNTFEDQFPLESEGAASADTDPAVVGDCGYITRDNGTSGADNIAPICLVQTSEDDATMWTTQDKMIDQINGFSSNNCLDPDDTQSCFVRFIKGVDTAFYSKINPGMTWSETLTYDSVGPTYQSSNLLFMEINPNIQPGTTINCRFRARFTNCNDCYSDSAQNSGDDFLDYEFSGDGPFKIINFKFTVNN